jgi:hypothetical protein
MLKRRDGAAEGRRTREDLSDVAGLGIEQVAMAMAAFAFSAWM